MKVVFSCVPQTGHITPLLPLAEAFTANGDEVIIASGPDVEDVASSRGLPFRPVGPAFDSWFSTLSARTRGIPGDGLAPSRVEGYFAPRLFGEVGMALVVDDLLALCTELEPALLIFDPYSFAAPLVAAVTGTHAVLHGIGPRLDPSVMDLVTDAVSPIWREFGFDVPSSAGVYAGTTVAVCPPSLDPVSRGSYEYQALRPSRLPLPEPAALPVSFANPNRPLIYLTLGTFSNNALDLFRLVLRALEDEPVNVIATVGRDNDPLALGPTPENAHVEQFIDQAQVLPHCTAVVHHAGAGTMFGVLAHGLPSVALPQSADNFINATLLARAGAAQNLMPGEVTDASVGSSLRIVLDNASYRQSAQLLADEINAMPSPREVASLLANR
jgi:UDP:flavonoid glycosyltransferase YjiC (YdhE family)